VEFLNPDFSEFEKEREISLPSLFTPYSQIAFTSSNCSLSELLFVTNVTSVQIQVSLFGHFSFKTKRLSKQINVFHLGLLLVPFLMVKIEKVPGNFPSPGIYHICFSIDSGATFILQEAVQFGQKISSFFLLLETALRDSISMKINL